MTRRLDISEVRKLAESRGGKLISKNYINAHQKLKWKCSKGHVWFAKQTNIKSGNQWCPVCANRVPYTLKDCIKIAKKRGGFCLSKKYLDNKFSMTWKCSNGHVWKTSAQNVITQKHWCNTCHNNKLKLNLKQIKKIASLNKGYCLSKIEFAANRDKLKWKCSKGHIWKATLGNVKRGQWCWICRKKLSIEEMQIIAKERGGKCLSKTYVDTDTHLKWECKEKHTWLAKPANIKNGTWCPKCMTFYSEEICRTTFEQIFNSKFIRVRPKWLVNLEGNTMQLDGYSKKYNLAFEYQGQQHYIVTRFSNTKEKLEKMKLRDRLKKKICKKNGVYLFQISYKTDLSQLPKLIEKKSKDFLSKNLNLNFKKNIDLNKIYSHKKKILEFHDIAKKKGGKCLSNTYLNQKQKLKFECSEGHVWKTMANTIKGGGSWCPYCAGKAPYSLNEINKILKKKGGICLSKKINGTKSYLKFQCKKKHIWKTQLGNIISGKWCPYCSGNARLTIEEMKDIAKERGGKCLSNKYVNSTTKLKWQCSNGHVWFAQPNNIKFGKWCKKCFNSNRYH